MRRIWLCVAFLVSVGEVRAGGLTFSNGMSSLTFTQLQAAAPIGVLDITFSNFTLAGFNGDNITVTPIAIDTGIGLSFAFNPMISAPAVGAETVTITYDAAVTLPQSFLSASDSFVADRGGVGTDATLGETAGGINLTQLSAANQVLSATAPLPATPQMVAVSDTASASNAQLNGGTATITSFTNTFVVPEPSSWVLGATAVAVLAGWRAMAKSARNLRGCA
jgi:hypothetical protein